MSTKVWAVNKETDQVMNINQIDKSYKGKMVCLDENCGEELIICMGEKNKPYFSHKKNTECKGGSTETLLHRLGKQILMDCETFVLPDEYIIFRQKKVMFSKKHSIIIRDVIPSEKLENGFVTGIKLIAMNGEEYYVELCLRDSKTSRKKGYVKNKCKAIAIDLHQFTRDVDSIDFKELTKFITGGSGIKYYITSPSMASVEKEIENAMFCGNGEYIACPAYGYEDIVERCSCSSCPFFLYSSRDDKTIHCAGKGCYSQAVDFKSMEQYELRRDRYIDLVPKPVWGVDRFAYRHVIGVCDKCKGELELGIGRSAKSISGISRVVNPTTFAYTVCKNCGRVEPIICPECGKPMELNKNRSTGRIFLGCSGYHDSDKCRVSLTMFNGEPCEKNYATQLLNVGSLHNFITDYDVAKKRLFLPNSERKFTK